MFEGHMDVVTTGDPTGWTYDPFGAQIVDARMYGRGTNDTKGNLAAMLIAMKALKDSGVALSGSIVGGVLCDEEEMMSGVQHFIAQGHADSGHRRGDLRTPGWPGLHLSKRGCTGRVHHCPAA